jgi:hypothetical protein
MATDDKLRRAQVEEIMQKLDGLSDAEITSLCEVEKGHLARRIPIEHQAALIDAGFGRHAREGFMLTDLGKAAAEVVRGDKRDL